jgi:hypothetical protein
MLLSNLPTMVAEDRVVQMSPSALLVPMVYLSIV